MSSYPVLRYTQARTDHDESILSSSASSYWDASHVENHPWLYIGSLSAAAESNDHLQSNNITRILTVASGRLNVSKATLPPCVNEHCTVGIDDHPRANFLNDAAEQCCEFINAAHADFESYMKKDIGTNNSSLHDKTPPSILVHCASGVSRSATAILIWLMSRSSEPSNTTTTTTTLRPTNQRQTLDEALGSIRQLRPTIHPNIGFMMQLGILDQCNGDLRKAILQWNTHCKGDAYDIVSAQRQKANDMHARVDELEVRKNVVDCNVKTDQMLKTVTSSPGHNY